MKSVKKVHINKKKAGAIAMGILLVAAMLGLQPMAERVGAFAAANLERKLPIYCVETDEP